MEAAFFILAIVTVVGALGAMFFRNVVHCALSLILLFFGIAGEFFLLRAEFLGAVQLLVYAGAVGVLVLFAIMLTRHFSAEHPFELFGGGKAGWFTGVLTAVVVTGSLVWAVLRDVDLSRTIKVPPTGSVKQLGQELMSQYVVPLEILAILLTAVMIGAIVLAMEGAKKRR